MLYARPNVLHGRFGFHCVRSRVLMQLVVFFCSCSFRGRCRVFCFVFRYYYSTWLDAHHTLQTGACGLRAANNGTLPRVCTSYCIIRVCTTSARVYGTCRTRPCSRTPSAQKNTTRVHCGSYDSRNVSIQNFRLGQLVVCESETVQRKPTSNVCSRLTLRMFTDGVVDVIKTRWISYRDAQRNPLGVAQTTTKCARHRSQRRKRIFETLARFYSTATITNGSCNVPEK